jgi:hypothetical protein
MSRRLSSKHCVSILPTTRLLHMYSSRTGLVPLSTRRPTLPTRASFPMRDRMSGFHLHTMDDQISTHIHLYIVMAHHDNKNVCLELYYAGSSFRCRLTRAWRSIDSRRAMLP